MVEIIPSVNEATWDVVKHRLERIAPFTDWVEIDVSDGHFTKTTTWNNPSDLKTLEMEKHVRIATHLMVSDPEKVLPKWIRAGVRRIIVQYEGIRGGILDARGKKVREMVDRCKENWVECGLSITVRTPLSKIKSYLPLLNVVQVLAVEPGPSGQVAKEEAFAMTETLRGLKGQLTHSPSTTEVGGFKIEWDGGVTLANVRKIKNAGADLIAAASAIFGSAEPEKSLEALKRELLG